MKKFSRAIRLVSLISLAIGLGMIMVAPKVVVTHLNGTGVADAFGSRWWLLLDVAIVIVVGEVMIAYAKHWRKKQGLQTVPLIMLQEWRLLAGQAVVLVVMIALMATQIGWL